MKRIFILFVLLSAFFSCVKKGLIGDRFVTLSYSQTYCADQWENNLSNDSLTLIHVSEYLKTKNLFFESLSIKRETAPDACSSCACKTGKVIYVSTFDNDSCKVQFARIGFK